MYLNICVYKYLTTQILIYFVPNALFCLYTLCKAVNNYILISIYYYMFTRIYNYLFISLMIYVFI